MQAAENQWLVGSTIAQTGAIVLVGAWLHCRSARQCADLMSMVQGMCCMEADRCHIAHCVKQAHRLGVSKCACRLENVLRTDTQFVGRVGRLLMLT